MRYIEGKSPIVGHLTIAQHSRSTEVVFDLFPSAQSRSLPAHFLCPSMQVWGVISYFSSIPSGLLRDGLTQARGPVHHCLCSQRNPAGTHGPCESAMELHVWRWRRRLDYGDPREPKSLAYYQRSHWRSTDKLQ